MLNNVSFLPFPFPLRVFHHSTKFKCLSLACEAFPQHVTPPLATSQNLLYFTAPLPSFTVPSHTSLSLFCLSAFIALLCLTLCPEIVICLIFFMSFRFQFHGHHLRGHIERSHYSVAAHSLAIFSHKTLLFSS